MASTKLYIPRINTYAEAFPISEGVCRLHFSIPAITSDVVNVRGIQISVTEQKSGLSVVKKQKAYSLQDNQEL